MRLGHILTRVAERSHVELRLRLWELQRRFRRSLTISTRQGRFKLLLGAEESIGRTLYTRGEYELDAIRQAMAFLRSTGRCPPRGSGTLVDVGANNGVISVGMLHTGEVARAIALEPEPTNFGLLQYNVALNGLEERVCCLPRAAAASPGEITFELSPTNFGDHRVRSNGAPVAGAPPELFEESARPVIRVPADRLDTLLETVPQEFTRELAVIWIDVQGYEGYVFRGATRLLATGVPVVSEIWPYGIRRAGMSREDFLQIATATWSSYWVWRRSKFVRYPIQTLDIFFEECGEEGRKGNVIFTV